MQTAGARLRLRHLPADLAFQIRRDQRGTLSIRYTVGPCCVAAFSGLGIVKPVAERFQCCGKLARVAGVDAIVLGRGVDEWRGIPYAGLQVVIRRIGFDKRPVGRNVGVSVLAYPCTTRATPKTPIARLAVRSAVSRCPRSGHTSTAENSGLSA